LTWFGGGAFIGGGLRLRLPTRAEVSLLLPEGPFTYFRGRVTAVDFG